MNKKIKSISIDGIDAIINNLLDQIRKDNFCPDIVVFIERAGRIIGVPLAEKLSVNCIGIEAKRPYSKIKKVFAKFLFFIPKLILNYIKFFELKTNFNSLNKKRNIRINFSIRNFKKILIIDDAIDTGETIIQVLDFIKNENSSAICKIAVITTTTNSPRIQPNYYIYNNIVCNFPWSIDSDYYKEFIKLYGNYYS